ncbi:cell division protein CrgA [Nocardioides zeae]|uniref:Cell division protein CrgA n=1 Tax=Nocardioides zeae TaxID=1457234 RepID=A0AAJ1X4W5_9ACTN|nr:cell division protein CrgA [Nocardioides zeae]MDQ1106012.1 hypothetical protein [Nocardioides zeae]
MSKSQSDPESTSEAAETSAATSKTKRASKASAKDTTPATASAPGGLRGRLQSRRDPLAGERPPLLSVRFVLMVLLVVAGIAWIALTWRSLGLDNYDQWGLIPAEEKPRRWVWELGLWNYAIGFGAILLGLVVGAHRSTPLGRGNGVVVGMLACFGIGLVWICTFYLFADDISSIWVFGALGQWNLVVGIAFMAVGFSYATKWE